MTRACLPYARSTYPRVYPVNFGHLVTLTVRVFHHKNGSAAASYGWR